MFLSFLAKNGFLSNPVDVIFFALIAAALAVVIILFIVSKVHQNYRDKKYEELERLAKEQESVAAQEQNVESSNDEVTEEVENTPVVEEEKVEEAEVEEVKVEEEKVVEEAKVEEVKVAEEVKEEKKPAAKKTTTTKKAPAKKTTAAKKTTTTKKAAPKAEEKTEEVKVVAEVKEEEKKPAAKKTTTTKKAAPKAEEKAEEAKVVAEVKEEEKKPAAKKTTTTKKAAPKVEVKEEEAGEQKGRVYSGKYEVYPSGDGYQYRLKASNGELLVVSEVYTTKDSALKAIEAVKRNVETGEIRIFKDKKGLFKFKLTSKNYRVIALGSSYATEKRATSASESFKKFALNSNVVEIDTPTNQDNIVEALVDTSSAEEKNGGKYLVEKFDGEYSWDLKASNGQILCQAEGYTSKTGVMSSIESFKRNVETGSFKILKDKNDHYHYNLYTASGRLANIGETYNSKQLAESAALSVVSFFKNAEIEEKK